MFKRLMERLSGKAAPSPVATPAPPQLKDPRDNELIKFYDGYGREIQITRAQWRDKVLLPNLKSNWDVPDALYNLILSGMKDGEAAELVDAGKHLCEIDPQVERSHVTYGIVLMKLERFEEAEAVFRLAISSVGETGVLLANLAKIESQRGEHIKAEAMLWQALKLDPNLDNGLMWWAMTHKDREGEEGYVNALLRVTALSDSWRAQLYLARHYLQKGELGIARAIYEEVLAGSKFGSDALVTISGDLGNSGQVPLMIELVAPVLDLQKHDARAGLNLLQAYLQLRHHVEGEALLSKLYALNMAPYKQHLDHCAQEFQRIRDETYAPAPVDEKKLEVVTVPFDVPIWRYGLRDPSWLLRNKDPGAKKIVFLTLGARIHGEGVQTQRENVVGRLSRTLPLYLAESVHVWTDHQCLTMIPVVRGGGPVLYGAPDDDTQTIKSFEGTGDFIVLGSIEEREERWHVILRVWSVEAADWISREEFNASLTELGREVLLLEQRMLSALGGARSTPLDAGYERPPENLLDPYLTGLGQSLMLSLVANRLVPKETLWGERNLIEWWLRMALSWPNAHVPPMAYLAAISNAGAYGSKLLEEFRGRTHELMKDNGRMNSPASKLAPVVWKAFGMTEELEKAALACVEEGRSDEYRQWLDRLVHHPGLPVQENGAEVG
ncbi:MAG: tetratricopeptide repeat protein [Dyella sp.]|uniref:tetratricopeptide repeat protein n=1 Tax=Dyella sp. TaxID=1869338 RepID=UPI003F7D45CE